VSDDAAIPPARAAERVVTSVSRAGMSLRDGMDLSGLTYPQLWLRYIGIGGVAASTELRQQIADDDQPGWSLDAYEHNLIAQALNEHFLDLDQDHPVGYREPAEDPEPTG
jgi:hypothetical protein